MAKSVVPSVPAHLEVMRGWLGTKEIKGPRANPIIAGTPQSWSALVDRPDVTSDEVANCAMAGGAALVAAEFFKAEYELKDLIKGGPSALTILAQQGIFVPLPPKDQRLLAQSYNSYGTDARKNPQPGDIMILPRGDVRWQGHFVFLDTYLGNGRWRCIGANQSDTTSYAEHHVSEAMAIRRYVPPTIKDLRAAGSQAIARGDQQEAAGAALAVGVPAVTVAAKVVEASASQPAVDAAANLPQLAEQTGVLHTLTTTGVAMGNLVLQSPWLVGCVGAGILVWYLGRTGKLRRLASHIAGAPLSTQTS
jgi:hypothetical protein